MKRTLGIDISKCQRGFNWPAVYAEGVRFSVCRATEGTTLVDPRFEDNHTGAESAGILTGSYHDFRPHKDPELQARHYYKIAGERTHLPPAIHFDTLNGVSGEDAFFRARRFVEITEVLWDRPCMISTYHVFWLLLGDPCAPDFGDRALWIAHYTAKEPTIPRPWSKWTFWQFDGEDGQLLPGGVDSDFNWFDGSEEDLRTFCRQSMPTVETVS